NGESNRDRPDSRNARQRRIAPALFREKRKIHARQDQEGHQQVYAYDYDKRDNRRADRRRYRATLAMRYFGGIELMRGRRAFGNELIVREGAAADLGHALVAFAGSSCRGLSASEPPQSKRQHDRRGDDSQPGRREWRRSEKWHGDGVLNRRCPWHGRHGEGRRAESDRCRHQPLRDVRRPEQFSRHRRQDEKGNKQAHAAIGDQCASKYNGQDRPLVPELGAHEIGDGLHRSAVVHELSEQCTKEKYRKELRHELCCAYHESLRPVGEHWLSGEGRSQERYGRREKEHTPSAKREPDQQAEGNEDSDEAHGVKPAAEGRPDQLRSACRYSCRWRSG